jgi:hypothetical protein
MTLESDILADFRQLLAEHGATARWQGTELMVLAGRTRREQQIDIGGFVDWPELSLRVPKTAFTGPRPKSGERIEVDGSAYRITQVAGHPRSPLLTLTLATADE